MIPLSALHRSLRLVSWLRRSQFIGLDQYMLLFTFSCDCNELYDGGCILIWSFCHLVKAASIADIASHINILQNSLQSLLFVLKCTTFISMVKKPYNVVHAAHKSWAKGDELCPGSPLLRKYPFHYAGQGYWSAFVCAMPIASAALHGCKE